MTETLLPNHLVGHQTESTRHRILLNAVQLFSQNSYSDVSLDKIATACGIKKQSILHYFPSKKAIVMSAIREIHQHHQAAINSETAPSFTNLIQEYFVTHVDGRFIMSLAANALAVYPEFHAPVQDFFVTWQIALASYLGDEKNSATVRNALSQLQGAMMLDTVYKTKEYTANFIKSLKKDSVAA